MRTPFVWIVLTLIGWQCTLASYASPVESERFAVLVFTKTTGFRHDSIPAGIATIRSLGFETGFDVDATEDSAVFTDANLAGYRVVVFLNTTGDVLNPSQQVAFERFIRSGGGFAGIHSASDTEYEWPWYGRLVGAYFAGHPAIQNATLKIADANHPSTMWLPPEWIRTDEWYDFAEDPSPNVKVLVTIDETTYSGGQMGAHHPLAWYHVQDGGRAWYTAMGHTMESYSEPLFRAHLLGGIMWAANVPASTLDISVDAGGAVSATTGAVSPSLRAGFAMVNVVSGTPPYGTAIYSIEQNGVIVSEAAVPSSPPTTAARIFVDYRTGVAAGSGTIDINTGIAVANPGRAPATITFSLRGAGGNTIASGTGTLPAGNQRAQFIDQLGNIATGFALPDNFPTSMRFGSLEISSSTPVSIVALRLTRNQRGETLLTSTPVGDLTQSLSTNPLAFPQFVDGGGYTMMIILLNTSDRTETGRLQTYSDNGTPISVRQAGGTVASSFEYSIPPGGLYVLETDGSPPTVRAGWAQVTPAEGTPSPIGAGVFRFSQGSVVVTECGVPSASAVTRARIYIDTSNAHDTGVALAGPAGGVITLQAFRTDGISLSRTSAESVVLGTNGHTSRFVRQMISGLPAEFTGVLEISSATPFVALTLRSLVNARREFLLTTMPIADGARPVSSPLIFPQIADGGGYKTEILLISPNLAAAATLTCFSSMGAPLAILR